MTIKIFGSEALVECDVRDLFIKIMDKESLPLDNLLESDLRARKAKYEEKIAEIELELEKRDRESFQNTIKEELLKGKLSDECKQWIESWSKIEFTHYPQKRCSGTYKNRWDLRISSPLDEQIYVDVVTGGTSNSDYSDYSLSIAGIKWNLSYYKLPSDNSEVCHKSANRIGLSDIKELLAVMDRLLDLVTESYEVRRFNSLYVPDEEVAKCLYYPSE